MERRALARLARIWAIVAMRDPLTFRITGGTKREGGGKG